MPVKLKRNNSIVVNDMKDGQIAEIVEWTDSDYIGQIVQRFGDGVLITIGSSSGNSFTSLFDSIHDTCKVRLLESGECIEIKGNK